MKKNKAIYVNSSFYSFCCAYDFMLLLCIITHGQQQQVEQQQKEWEWE